MPGYYETKGTGSQEVYDAYYDDYGDSQVWGSVNVGSQINIANRGNPEAYITTADSIENALDRMNDSKTPIIFIIGGIIAYKFLI